MKKLLLVGLIAFVIGCSSAKTTVVPKFVLTFSEYPSWSVFGVAHEKGLINGKEGELGSIEKKYGVDIVLKEADYDTCITLFGSGSVDASCQTNIDSLAPSLGRESVIIMPTSTSVGGDACIAVDYNGQKPLEFLKGKTTYGLEKSVSQYAFERNLQILDKNVDLKQYPFKNMDPAAASTAIQTGQKNIESIMVWNPFVLQILRTKDNAKVVFDSSKIPEEIIDCVVIGKDSLNKPGGKEFALAIIDSYYSVCNMLESSDSDATYVALGAKFSSLNAKDMRLVCQQTRFYNTPEKALALMTSKKFQTETMPMIIEWCVSHDMLNEKPTVGYDQNARLNFDTSYLKAYKK